MKTKRDWSFVLVLLTVIFCVAIVVIVTWRVTQELTEVRIGPESPCVCR